MSKEIEKPLDKAKILLKFKLCIVLLLKAIKHTVISNQYLQFVIIIKYEVHVPL